MTLPSRLRGREEAGGKRVFLDEDEAIAARKRHLTTAQAGSLGRGAGVKRVVPFYFSPRYRDQEDRLRREVEDAFAGIIDADRKRGGPVATSGRIQE